MFKTLAVGLGAAALLTQCAPTNGCAPASPAAATTSVTRVIDGDTVEIPGDTIRIIGIDTPEQGTCGFDAAKARMTQLVQGQTVSIPGGARDDRVLDPVPPAAALRRHRLLRRRSRHDPGGVGRRPLRLP